MYDLIICRYPLPGEPPSFCANADHQYQSKSLDCELATYEITNAGELKKVVSALGHKLNEPQPVSFNGVLEFYGGNLTATAYGISFTPAGEDQEWIAYEATFVNGVVQSIIETERERGPALPRYVLEEIEAKFDKDAPEVTMTEPEIGQLMYLQWIGMSKGYPVTLLKKKQGKWELADESGKIYKSNAKDLGRGLFHSKEEAETSNAWKQNSRELKGAYAKKLLRARLTHPS